MIVEHNSEGKSSIAPHHALTPSSDSPAYPPSASSATFIRSESDSPAETTS